MVIDPGPVIEKHLEAILEEVEGSEPTAVLVTHSHIDHAPLANSLANELGVPALGHSAGEDFTPDQMLSDGDTVLLGDEVLTVVATPGHSNDHLCFKAGSLLFTGDHIMGGSTVMVQHMGDYLRSLEKVARLAAGRLLPGHGPVIDNPDEVIDYYITHRLEREEQIVDALQRGDESVGAVVERVYADVDRELHPIAAISVAAHLRKLHEEKRVTFEEPDDLWSGIVELLPT